MVRDKKTKMHKIKKRNMTSPPPARPRSLRPAPGSPTNLLMTWSKLPSLVLPSVFICKVKSGLACL